jgi:hypothetical protein
MSCANLIRRDESHFNLAHRLVSVIVENNSLNFDEVWCLVSNNSIQQLQKRFRRLKKANNPLKDVKKPRTSFSFYTKNCRVKIAKANPKATFGELSKLVSKSWAGLSDKEKATYKKMETDDKQRYLIEKEKVLSELPVQGEVAETVVEASVESTEDATPTKKRKTTSGKESSSRAKKPTTTDDTTVSSSKSSTKSASTETSSKVKPYNVFQREQRALLKKTDPKMSLKDVNSRLGTMWKGLSDTDRVKYSATA